MKKKSNPLSSSFRRTSFSSMRKFLLAPQGKIVRIVIWRSRIYTAETQSSQLIMKHKKPHHLTVGYCDTCNTNLEALGQGVS